MIERDLKRCLGQMAEGVQVVSASHEGLVRAYTSHWVSQISFEEPIVMASISPKHDTHPLLVGSGRFAVSILAGDQVAEGQYFSYPGRRFAYIADEYLHEIDGWSVVPNCLAWLGCDVVDVRRTVGTSPVVALDHDLVFARVVAYGAGRLGEAPLVYSSRHGWRIASEPAREPGTSVRDRLLARLPPNGD